MEDGYEEEDKYPYETETEKWNRENNTGMNCGTCPRCGSKIYQSTYADFCKCGDSDQGY
jgi:hypothetical protein